MRLTKISGIFLLGMWSLVFTACGSEENNQQEAEATPAELPVAVDDPRERDMSDFSQTSLEESGLPFTMALPEGAFVKSAPELGGWMILMEDTSFKLVVVPYIGQLVDIMNLWEGNPENYQFKQVLVETPGAVLFEMVRNGKVEYHVDAVFDGAESVRIYNAKDRPFSRYQAERMFHACRTIQNLRKEG